MKGRNVDLQMAEGKVGESGGWKSSVGSRDRAPFWAARETNGGMRTESQKLNGFCY